MAEITANENGANGIGVSEAAMGSMESVVASENARDGIYFSADVYSSEFVDVDASGNAEAGFWMTADSSGNVVRDTTIENNSGTGISYVENDDNEFQNVTVRGNDGWQVDSNTGTFAVSELQIGDAVEYDMDEVDDAVELWRYDGTEWPSVLTVDADEADGRIDADLDEDGVYAPVTTASD